MSLRRRSHLRDLFKKEKVQRSGCTSLPFELWEYIVSLLKADTGDLARLCRTSRTLQAICEPLLYRSLKIEARPELLEGLSCAVRNPRIAGLVTDFHITFRPIKMRRWRGEKDIHGRIDDSTSQVLTPLRNLQTLEHNCMACQNLSLTRHQYLRELETRKLRIFKWDSSKCYIRDSSILLEILAAPCMSTIRALTWDDSLLSPLSSTELKLVDNGEFLPNLNQVSSNSFRAFAPRLRKGKLRAAYALGSSSSLLDILPDCAPGIKYLSHQNMQILLPKIVQNSTPYLKIESMLWFYMDIVDNPDKIITSLKVLSRLPKLIYIGVCVSFHIRRSSAASHPYSRGRDPGLARDLKKNLHRLSRVYIDKIWLNKESSYEQWDLTDDWQFTELHDP